MLELVGKEVLEPMIAWLRANAAYAPLILFGVMLLEGIILTTFIFSGVVFVLAAGILIKLEALSYAHVFLAVVAGFWVGDTINYHLAQKGERWFRGLSVVRARPGMLEWAEAFIGKWGLAAIFLSRFMGPSRTFVTFLAGALRMPPASFHMATILATLLLTAGLLNAGMAGVELWEKFRAR
ncbi:MAG: DedA family protein [Beijerinckiaceae bacterium]